MIAEIVRTLVGGLLLLALSILGFRWLLGGWSSKP
jgi:hypothetical protein